MGATVALGVGPATAIEGIDPWFAFFVSSISVGGNPVVGVSPPQVKGVDGVGGSGVGEGVVVGAGLVVVVTGNNAGDCVRRVGVGRLG